MKGIKITAFAAIITLSIVCMFGCAPTYTVEPSGDFLDLSDMTLVLDEDFGSEPNNDVWTANKYWDGDHEYIRRGGYWDIDQCMTDNKGNLILRTEYIENGKYGNGYYTGMLNTAKRRKHRAYGRHSGSFPTRTIPYLTAVTGARK